LGLVTSEAPRKPFTRTGALLWIVAAVGFFLFEAISATAIEQTYSYARDYISTLGVPGRSSLAVLMNAAFVMQALLFPAGAALLVAAGRIKKETAFLVFTAFIAVGNLLVATVHGGAPFGTGPDWHGVGALLAIAGGNAAALAGSSALRRAGAPRAYRVVSVALAVLGFGCLVALQLPAALAVLPVGIWERGAVYAVYVWQTVTAVYLLRSAER
jgi:hypothetical membrane protein